MKSFNEFITEAESKPPKYSGVKWKKLGKGQTQEFDVEYESKIVRGKLTMTMNWSPEEPDIILWDINGEGSNNDSVKSFSSKKKIDQYFDNYYG